MPYLLLILGLLIGTYALYRFFIRADINQIKSLILAAFVITICVALFVLSVTGRLPAAIAIVSALSPFLVAWFSQKRRARGANNQTGTDPQKPMDRADALRVLGVDEQADDAAIKAAYKKLMKKVHPDQEGSQWMAEKLNEAKDLLLKK